MADLPEHVRAVIGEHARRTVAQAPPPKQWQIDILRPLFRDAYRRAQTRRPAA